MEANSLEKTKNDPNRLATIMSRILYAAPARWGLTQARDILKIDKLQRKLQRIEYTSHDHPTVESKLHKVEEKLFRKATVEEDHVLRQCLPQNNAIKYNLKPRPHNFCSRPKMAVYLSHYAL